MPKPGPSFQNPVAKLALLPIIHYGGARRDRTADPLHAMQVLSQLSYGPEMKRANLRQAPLAVKTGSKSSEAMSPLKQLNSRQNL